MALELEGSGSGDFVLKAATRGGLLELKVILHDDAVMLHGEESAAGFLAVGIELGRGKLDVVSLPLEGREAHVHFGGRCSDRCRRTHYRGP